MLRSGWEWGWWGVLMTGGELWSKNFCPEQWVTPAERLCHNNILVIKDMLIKKQVNPVNIVKIWSLFLLKRKVKFFRLSQVLRVSCAANFRNFVMNSIHDFDFNNGENYFEKEEDDDNCYAVNLKIYCLSTNWDYNRSTTMEGNYRPTKLRNFKSKPN